MSLPHPSVCLVVLDGWGIAPDGPGNAVSLADTPTMDGLAARYPTARLIACGPAVGLPEGQMGNSEVGHLNLGAGAVVKQDLARIDDAVRDGSLRENEALRGAMEGRGRVHLVGLASDGGVHSGWEHWEALIGMSAELAEETLVHAFTDGRDTSPTGGERHLEELAGWCATASADGAGDARVATVVGRYFAMDRDRRWERTQLAYDLLVHGRGEHEVAAAADACREAYARDETDEFVRPTVVGEPAPIRVGDAVVVVNFRPDRVRQITQALAEPGFAEVDRGGAAPVEPYVCMTRYKGDWDYPVAFPPRRPATTMTAVVAGLDGNAAQVHVAETEKYPHVTYFFGGGEEDPAPGEEREVVPSPRDVATYDEKPEMSAAAAAEAFCRLWREHEPRFGIINFANADMVGHTGSIPAATTAVETVDRCLADVVETVTASGGVCFVTADHGNADEMLEEDGSPDTAHSLNPVPVVVTDADVLLREEGVLADVAPTLLELLGVAQPEEMTGRSMLAG